jgi:tRNA threonylcarbamoyladenosine biosynthesis protein TsaE
MTIHDEAEMISYGEQFAKSITPPAVIELIGDVGAGKTTFVRGFVSGFNIAEPVTSPSFVINKKYHGEHNITISHYDFYRLPDPGLMSEELSESIADPNTITIVEWADTVANVLPEQHTRINILYNDDGSRELEVSR